MARRLIHEIEIREHGELEMVPASALLRRLAAIEAPGVLSLFLDTRWDDEQARGHARDELGRAIAAERERGIAHEDDLRRAERYADGVIRQRIDAGFEGIAAFFAARADLDVALLTHAALPTTVVVGDHPYLAPLVRCVNDFELALIVLVEHDGARLLELAMGGLLSDALLVQQRISDQLVPHHRDSARALTLAFDRLTALRGEPPRVVLGGREPALSVFERRIPERILRRALRTTSLDPTLAPDAILAAVHGAIDETRRTTAADALGAVRDAAAIGRGAVELRGVLAALNEGKLRELWIDRRFEAAGRVCTRCDQLIASPEDTPCPGCHGVTVPRSLVDEIVRRAVLASADVHSLDGGEWSGIAATFRY